MTWAAYKPGADPGDPACEEDSRRRWLRLGPGDVMLDAGAYAGSWSVPALLAGASVVAVEPNQPVWELVEYAAVHGLAGRLRVIRKLLADVDDDRSCRLDSLGLARLDFVKMDIEGDELKALAGGLETLRRCRPRMMVEVHTGAVAKAARVRVADVTGLLDGADLKYRYEPVVRQENWYVHLYCEPIAE